MRSHIITFVVGFIFAIGLGVSGMTNPHRVIGFLDIFGGWDPTLAFVMIGAIGFHALVYPLITRRQSPILAEQFHIPKSKNYPPSLILGAALFGVGWGLSGYCPGPGIVSLGSGQFSSLIFVFFMLVGMLLFRWTKPWVDKYLN